MFKLILSLLSVYFLISCATIVKGTKQLVTINCNVEQAKILLDGVEIGYTPFTGEIKKGKKIITVQKEGYKTYQVAMSTTLEGMFWGNIITGGTLGSLTDFATGAAYAYSPSSFQVELAKEGMSFNEFEKTLNLKKFAMINMSSIATDLSKNEGPYLSSLLSLANMEENSSDIELIKDTMIESKGDQVDFGKLMTEHLQF